MRRRTALMLTVVAAMLLSGAVTAPARTDTRWVPAQGERWQVQLQGKILTNLCIVPYAKGSCVRPSVYDIDLYNVDGTTPNAAAVTAIHALGAHAVCYVDAGSWENWRPDAAAFPAEVKGASNGWPGERWLDVRAVDVLIPIIAARVDKCVAAGFDAVDYDNVDGYTNTTGFPLTAADQLAFNLALADVAHARGLSVGLKNDLLQLGQLQSTYDFAVNEQCAQYQECNLYDAWTAAGKAVVQIEYKGVPKKYCADAALHGRDAVHKALALRAKAWKTCR